MKTANDWGKPVVVKTETKIDARKGKVIEYLRQAVSQLKPTDAANGYAPRVELKSDTARGKLSALYAARTRLQKDDKTYKQLKFKLQGDTILIWLQK